MKDENRIKAGAVLDIFIVLGILMIGAVLHTNNQLNKVYMISRKWEKTVSRLSNLSVFKNVKNVK